MKHLKLFENVKPNVFYLFDYYDRVTNVHTFKLFPDRESVELEALTFINEERKMEPNYTDDMYFIDCNKALDWYKKNHNNYISTHELKLLDKLIPDSKLEFMRDTNKYNL